MGTCGIAAGAREVRQVDAALASDAGNATRLVEELEKVKAAQLKASPKADTSAIDAQIAAARKAGGMAGQGRNSSNNCRK